VFASKEAFGNFWLDRKLRWPIFYEVAMVVTAASVSNGSLESMFSSARLDTPFNRQRLQPKSRQSLARVRGAPLEEVSTSPKEFVELLQSCVLIDDFLAENC